MSGINLLDQLNAKRPREEQIPLGETPAKAGGGLFSRLKFKTSKDPSEDTRLLMRLLITAGVFYGAYYFFDQYLTNKVQVVQTELTDIRQSLEKENAKKAKLKAIGDEMRGYQSKVDELKTKLAAVGEKDSNRAYLVKAMEYVAVEMPKDIWFSEVSLDRGDAPANAASAVKFAGYALNAQAVSEFIVKLDMSVYFPTATLENMELLADAPGASGKTTINIPANSRKFSVMTRLGE